MGIRKVYLEITDECNLNCKICYREAWKHKPRHMEKEIVDEVIEQIKTTQGVEEIVLGGIGEPTLSPDILYVIEELNKYHITITTNGTLLYNGLNSALIEYVDAVVVSIDGLEKKFEELRGEELSTVIKNVKNIILERNKKGIKKPSVNFQFVASSENIDDIFGVIDLGGKIGINKLIISNLLPQTEENKDKILYTRYENKYMKELLSKASNYSFKKGVSLILPNIELKTERRCRFIEEDAIYINSLGDIVPCYRFAHTCNEIVFSRKKTIEKFEFGNVMNKSLIDIWNSKEYKEFRKMVYNNLYPSCTDCDLVEGCDMVKDGETNCYSINPSCGDCLWSRNIIICP